MDDHQAAETPLIERVAKAVEQIAEGPRMILDSFPNDPSMLSSSYGPEVTLALARLWQGRPTVSDSDYIRLLEDEKIMAYELALKLMDRSAAGSVIVLHKLLNLLECRDLMRDRRREQIAINRK